MDVPQEVEGEEKAHATFDGEVGDRLDSSLIASREQMAASNRPTSSIEAPRPHKRSPTYSEEFLSETHVNQESSPFGQAARWMTDSREPPVLPRSNIVPSTALAGSNTGSSRGATRDRFSRYGAHLSCVPCRRRKVRCNGKTPCALCQRSKIECEYSVRGRQAHRTRTDDFAIRALETIEKRGRSRDREDSPPLFQSNERALSHSPDSQFYHDEPEADIEAKPVTDTIQFDGTDMYQYTPLDDSEVRLLRISPGLSEDPMFCALKVLPIGTMKASALEFQALSYAWTHDHLYDLVFLIDASPSDLTHNLEEPVRNTDSQQPPRPFMVHRNLFSALRRIRHKHDSIWLWVDALCIDQSNDAEKSHQIPKMPDIYANAWNVIVWLGEELGRRSRAQECTAAALRLIPKLLNLKVLDSMLQSEETDNDLLESWVSFMDILYLPWFSRRWVIQEIACARRLSLRMGCHVVSWIDFADAVELFLDKLDRMRDLYGRSHRARYNPDALEGFTTSGARALMELSRNVFRKGDVSQTLTRLMDLESLVLSTTNFAVTEVRDVVYALLHLANDIARDARSECQEDHSESLFSFITDYTRHPVDIFADFVIYCVVKSQSLDIICRHWTIWPRASPEVTVDGRELPSWIGAASFIQDGLHKPSPPVPKYSLVGAPQKPIHDASRETSVSFRHSLDVLHVTGLIIGKVQSVSARIIEGMVSDDCLQMLGWTGSLADGLPNRLWRSLVANRTTDGRMVPGWYRRACALALTKLTSDGDLSIPRLLSDSSQPSTMIEYLKRVQEVVHSRKSFTSTFNTSYDSQEEDHAMEVETTTVGLGPRDMSPGDMVCILFGCSVPVILRPVYKDAMEDETDEIQDVKLIGEAYVHDHMEGEILVGLAKQELERRSTTFRIH